MKSLSVKKIAVAAVGAAFVGSALAVGAVSVDPNTGSFPFFANGEPNVKVVVGSRAAASDAVAAGNIAAMLGNLAYTNQAVSINGKAGLTCSGGAGGSGTATCTVSNKFVELTVTTPGVNPATAFEMKTYVQDNLDYNVDTTRNTTTSFSADNVSFGSPSGPKQITNSLTAVLKPVASMPSDGSIPNGRSLSIKQEQRVYAFGFVNYDTSAKKLRSENSKTGYEVVFSDPLPYCLDTSKNSTSCTSDSDKLFKNNVRISFLGDRWTVMSMTVSAGAINQVILGQEVAYNPIMRVNDVATTPDGFTVKLIDLSGFGYGTGGSSLPRVSFQIMDKDGKLVKQITVDESATTGTTVTEANNLVITVNKAFPGAFALEAYADVSIYAQKLELTNNQEVSGGASHKNWKARIVNTTLGSSEAIQKIQLYNDIDQLYKSPITQALYQDESIDIIKGLPGFRLNFLGLEKVDYDTLNFAVQKDATLPVNSTHSAQGDFILLTSARSDAFDVGAAARKDSVYFMVKSHNATSGAPGDVFYYDSALGYYAKYGTANRTVYYPTSTESAIIAFNTTFNSTNNQTAIAVPEITEDANGTQAVVANANAGNYHWNLRYDATLRQFVNTMGSTTVDKIGYDSGVLGNTTVSSNQTSFASFEPGYISYRGSIFNSISSGSASISYATRIAHARFTLTGGNVGSSANSAQYKLKEGDTQDIGGGYSITINGLPSDVSGVCGAGTGGAAGSCGGADALTTTPSSAAVVTRLNTATNSLVMLDSQAAGSSSSLIVVGGQAVNSLASGLGTVLTSASSDSVIKVDGSKLYVAGYTAAQTQDAANALVQWLSDNRDTLTG
jgi:hypothetical protein